MTENEAKTKWCPLARVAVGISASANRDNAGDGDITTIDENAKCIGSACMAWRVEKEQDTYGGCTIENVIGGYCGAFGKI